MIHVEINGKMDLQVCGMLQIYDIDGVRLLLGAGVELASVLCSRPYSMGIEAVWRPVWANLVLLEWCYAAMVSSICNGASNLLVEYRFELSYRLFGSGDS